MSICDFDITLPDLFARYLSVGRFPDSSCLRPAKLAHTHGVGQFHELELEAGSPLTGPSRSGYLFKHLCGIFVANSGGLADLADSAGS